MFRVKQISIYAILYFLFFTTLILAQDTLVVTPNVFGAINEAINGDTTLAGERNNPNRVYKLLRDSYYPISGTIRNADYHLNIFGEKGTATKTPPIISVSIIGDRAPIRVFDAIGDITVKNVYFNGITPEESQSDYFIFQTKDSTHIEIENCIFEWCTNTAIRIEASQTSLSITNSMAKNIGRIGSSVQPGHFVRFRNADAYKIYFVNNTFHSSKGLLFPNGLAQVDTVIMNNNTLFNCTREPLRVTFSHVLEAKNNLIVNVGIRGGYPWINAIDDQDALTYGIFNLDTLGGGATITEAERKVDISNNNYFLDQVVHSYFDGVDTISAEPFMNARTQHMIDTYPNFTAENNNEIDPLFVNAPGQIAQFVELYKQFHKHIPATDPAPDVFYYAGDKWNSTWPLTEDFSFTENLLGTDGEKIGDQDWFSPGGKHVGENVVVGVNDDQVFSLPSEFSLEQNYPNPFNPSTTIKYSLNKTAEVTLNIINVLGQNVRTLVNKVQNTGSYSAQWNGKDDRSNSLSSGIYFYQLKVGSTIMESKKMVLMK